jgi:L-lactate dehydrogenase complex protein LldG
MSASSRETILRRLRKQLVPAAPLPEVLKGPWIDYPDPIHHLTQLLASVGGELVCVERVEQVAERLESFEQFRQARHVISTVPGIRSDLQLDQVESPRELEATDFMITTGHFVVVENGAVWVTDERVRHRAALFLTQHLVLLVERQQWVPTMHAAYARLDIGRRPFGCFISGPSKTADIEQSLVIGAHGCKTMQLYLVDQLETA